MFSQRFAVNAGLLVLLAMAALGWWGSRLPYPAVLAHLNGLAPDGDVESYTPEFHGGIQGNMRALVGVSIIGAAMLLLYRLRMKATVASIGPFAGLRSDIATAWQDMLKETSRSHARLVLLFMLAGIVLRVMLLWQPITYDEAFTYTYYASRPLHVIVSDYSYPNNHILHTLLVKLSTKLFGVGLVSLRLPAFLAGVLVLPVFYFFVRAMFNRYIALMALALACASGPLVDYSALARGYSLTWFFMMMALLIGRYSMKKDRPIAAILLGLCCALGMWTMPSFLYIAAMVYIWLVVSLMVRYDESLNGRLMHVLLSGVVLLAVTMLLYLPVILVHGVDQIVSHDTYGIMDRTQFSRSHQDRGFELWAVLVDSSSWWIAMLGFAALFYAAYTSSKYRALLAGLLFGAVPIVVLQAVVAPPRVWFYSVFIFHIGSALALFYLLKAVQERFWPASGKRQRTVLASTFLFILFAWKGMHPERLGQGEMAEAAGCARQVVNTLRSGDKFYAQYPWDSPIEFHLIALGADRGAMYGACEPGHAVLVAVGTEYDQTLDGVLAHNRVARIADQHFRLIQDNPRLKIFAAP